MVQQSITNIMEAKGKEMIRWDFFDMFNFPPIFIVPWFVLFHYTLDPLHVHPMILYTLSFFYILLLREFVELV